MVNDWKKIADVMGLDSDYKKFRASVREFMVKNELSVFGFFKLSGIGFETLSCLIHDEQYNISFKSVVKLKKFMDGYQSKGHQ